MIELRDVCKTFQHQGQQQYVMNYLSLSISSGEIFGIIGQSGAGKSTLLRLLNGLEIPDQGDIEVFGQPIPLKQPKEMRRYCADVAMVFQGDQLLQNLTVLQNVSLPLKLHPGRQTLDPLQALEWVGLSHLKDKYPGTLSGGQKQRVGIARALVTQPKLLLLDEPTSALDEHTTQEIAQVLTNINQELGVTIVLVTHQVSLVQAMCHRAVIMQEGKLSESINLDPTRFRYPYSSYEDYLKGVFRNDT